MPLPEVAVEIAALATVEESPSPETRTGDASEALRDTLLNACTDAAGTAVCVPADQAIAPEVVARIEWFTDRIVRLEVRGAHSSGDPRLRLLRFGPHDQPEEVWRAVGFSVGTIAGVVVREHGAGTRSGVEERAAVAGQVQRTGEAAAAPVGAGVQPEGKPELREEAPAPDEDRSAKPRRARHRPTEASRQPPWWIGLGGLAGPGLDSGGWKVGASVRVARGWNGPFVTAAVDYALSLADVDGVRAKWIAPGAGAGYLFAWRVPVQLALRGELIAERLRADVESGGEADGALRWMPAFRFGADLTLPARSHFGLTIGAQGIVRTAPTDIGVRDDVIATAPLFDFQLGAALRVALP